MDGSDSEPVKVPRLARQTEGISSSRLQPRQPVDGRPVDKLVGELAEVTSAPMEANNYLAIRRHLVGACCCRLYMSPAEPRALGRLRCAGRPARRIAHTNKRSTPKPESFVVSVRASIGLSLINRRAIEQAAGAKIISSHRAA